MKSRTIVTSLSASALSFAAVGLASAQDARERRELARYQARLIEGSRDALAARSFAERNRVQAEAVTAESAELAARALGLTEPTARTNLTRVFHSATLQSGEAFERAFQGDVAAKKAAPLAAGEVAYKHLPAALAAVRGSLLPTRADAERAAGIIERARIEDVARIVAKDLGVRPLEEVRGRLVRRIRAVVPTSDRFYGEIDRIPQRAPKEQPLSMEERGGLRAGIRMAHANRKAGQVHRAILDRNPSRVQTTGSYNPFDLMMRTIYRSAYEQELAQLRDKAAARERALVRTVFEVYKDLHELRRGHEKLRGDTERQYAQETRARLGRLYVDELRTKTIPQLIAEATRQGIDLRASRHRLSRLSIMSALSGLDRRAVKRRAQARLEPHVVANGLTFTDKNGRKRFLPFAGPAGQRLSQADRERVPGGGSQGARSRLEGLIPGGGSGRRGARR